VDWPWDADMGRTDGGPGPAPCPPPRSPFEAARACGCPEAAGRPRSPFEALRGLGLPRPVRPTSSPFAAACELAHCAPSRADKARWPLYLACALLLHGAVLASGLLPGEEPLPPEPPRAVMEISLGSLAVPAAPEAAPQQPEARPEPKPVAPPVREKVIATRTSPTAAPAPEPAPRTEAVSEAPAVPAPAVPAPAVPAAPARRPGPDGAYGQEDVDRKPSALSASRPAYPLKARKKNITGKVLVRFLVRPDGQVDTPRIVSAEPEGVFEESVLAAVRTWRFVPGQVDGRAVATWVQAPVVFSLSD